MAEYWNEDDDDDNADVQGDGPEGLRKAHRAAVRDKKALEKQVADLNTQLASLSGQVRSTSLSELLQAKGVASKVAKFYPSDAAVDEAAVNQWLADNGDVFNVKVADSGTPPDGAASQDQGDQQQAPPGAVSQDDLANLLAALSAGAGGGVVPAPGAFNALASDVENNAKSFEDVLALMNKHGIETKTGY